MVVTPDRFDFEEETDLSRYDEDIMKAMVRELQHELGEAPNPSDLNKYIDYVTLASELYEDHYELMTDSGIPVIYACLRNPNSIQSFYEDLIEGEMPVRKLALKYGFDDKRARGMAMEKPPFSVFPKIVDNGDIEYEPAKIEDLIESIFEYIEEKTNLEEVLAEDIAEETRYTTKQISQALKTLDIRSDQDLKGTEHYGNRTGWKLDSLEVDLEDILE